MAFHLAAFLSMTTPTRTAWDFSDDWAGRPLAGRFLLLVVEVALSRLAGSPVTLLDGEIVVSGENV